MTRAGPPAARGCLRVPGRQRTRSVRCCPQLLWGTDLKICAFGPSSEANENSTWVRKTGRRKKKISPLHLQYIHLNLDAISAFPGVKFRVIKERIRRQSLVSDAYKDQIKQTEKETITSCDILWGDHLPFLHLKQFLNEDSLWVVVRYSFCYFPKQRAGLVETAFQRGEERLETDRKEKEKQTGTRPQALPVGDGS